ncbi:MAG: energy transducer TonB [Vicinamibacteraceae bacterium]
MHQSARAAVTVLGLTVTLATAAHAEPSSTSTTGRVSPTQAVDTSREVGEALARPMSPAAIVLLLPHMSLPAAVERVAQALRDPSPEVRAVAARVAFTTRHQGLVTALTAALEAEADVGPASEMARALALIAGAPADDAAFTAMARTGRSVGEAWVSVVARTRPADIVPRLPVLGGSADEAVANLAATDTAAVARAFAPLSTTPALEAPYLALLERLDRDAAAAPWPVLAVGLKASTGIRHTLVRLLLHRRASRLPLAPEAESVLADLRARTTAADDPYLAMTFELLRRGEKPGDPPVPLGPIIAALDRESFPGSHWRDGWMRRLDTAEEAALRARLPMLPREQWAPESGSPSTAGPAPAANKTPEMVVRMVRPLTPRLVAELAEATGCRPARDQVLAVQVTFRPTGQVHQVYNPVGIGVERCARAARLLVALDIAGGQAPIPAERTDLVLIGFRPEDAKCPRIDLARAGNEIRVGSGMLRPPRKVRNISPVYPQEMQDLRIQGVVLIEATVAPTGCIADATVLRGPHATMNAAALAAVSLWQYEPSVLDGTPVPIIMTVTVNFTLQP